MNTLMTGPQAKHRHLTLHSPLGMWTVQDLFLEKLLAQGGLHAPIPALESFPPEIRRVIWFAHPINAADSPYAAESMWAIYEAHRQGIPLTIVFPEPTIHEVFSSFESYTPDQWLIAPGGIYRFRGDIEIYATSQVLDDAAKAFPKIVSSAQVVIPKYSGWGSFIRIVQQFEAWNAHPDITLVDPSPAFVASLEGWEAKSGPRVSKWVLTRPEGVSGWLVRRGLQWPVTDPLDTSETLAKWAVQLGRHYAAIMPEWDSDGIGWFDPVFLLAANRETFLWPGRKNAVALGGTYEMSPSEFENKPLGLLSQAGRAQKREFASRHAWGVHDLQAAMDAILEYGK